jgi:7-cyano-7-deazaguanine synthase
MNLRTHLSDSIEGIAVLASGGIDSCVLMGELVSFVPRVVPIHIRFGLKWEEEELALLEKFLGAIACDQLAELKHFEMPLGQVYIGHWSVTGDEVPTAQSEDAAVFLPGRNLFQLVQPGVWCHLNGVKYIALATLSGNPFADATPEFFDLVERALNLSLGGELKILRPYEQLSKVEVIQRGREMPLELTMSCIQPAHGRHCGQCNKCAERRQAFEIAGVADRTPYDA